MKIKEIKNELDFIEIQLNKSFKEFVIEGLEEAEVSSYSPSSEKVEEELQLEFIEKLTKESYEDYRYQLVKRAIALQSKLDEYQNLQDLLNRISEIDIIETPKTVVMKQIKKNYILIEEEEKTKDEYTVFDWLADADPENFLGFQ